MNNHLKFNVMKTIKLFLILFSAIVISSCEGPMGPPGYDGLDGEDLIGTIFEIKGDFTPANDFRLYFDFPGNFEIYDTDVVLVYMLWEQTDGLNVWRLMPQTVVLNYVNNGNSETEVLQYNYDYTVADVQVFLEGTIDFSTLLPAEWKDQIFRIAVLPADFMAKNTIDETDLNSVMNSMNFNLNSIEKINF